MPKRALAEKRPILLASLAASLAFFALRQSPVVPEMFLIPLKGAAVGLLALYAAWRGTGRDAVLLAFAFVLAALGDIGMEIDRGAGAILFVGYHAVMIALYLRHPREALAPSQKALAVAMLVLTPLLFWLLPAERSEALPTAIYGLVVTAAAARVAAPVLVDVTSILLMLSAGLWVLAFLGFAAAYGPMLLRKSL